MPWHKHFEKNKVLHDRKLIEKKIKFFKIKYFFKIYLFSLSFPISKKSALGRKQTFMIKILDRIDEKSSTF